MFNISSYLSKYKKIDEEAEINKLGVIAIIHKVCGITISSDKVFTKKGFVKLKLQSAQKAQINLKKEKIMEKLKEGGYSIFEIKI